MERKTLAALGLQRLDFQPATVRQRIIPKRLRVQNKILDLEKQRLVEAATRNAVSTNTQIGIKVQ